MTPEDLRIITNAAQVAVMEQHRLQQEQIHRDTLDKIEELFQAALINAPEMMRSAAEAGHYQTSIYSAEGSLRPMVSQRLEKEFEKQGFKTKIDRGLLIVSW